MNENFYMENLYSQSLFDLILQLNQDFLQEANNSPTLLSDMAKMEKFLAESYSERIFAELLQNADDCQSSRILVYQSGPNLYVANDGAPFNEKDISAICRSGASSKNRGQTIGYRGVGFKSATFVSNEILIVSNGIAFSFSKCACLKALDGVVSDVPTVRIPFIVDEVETDIQNIVNKINEKGYTTVFVFRNANFTALSSELQDINYESFLFLNNVCQCIVNLDDLKKSIRLKRSISDNGYIVGLEGNDTSFWLVLKQNGVAIALKLAEGQCVPCSSEEARYYCFLPTLDKAPFNIKINADFSTEPSRKHLSLDNLSTEVLEEAGGAISTLVTQAICGELSKYGSHLLTIFQSQSAFSSANQIVIRSFKETLKSQSFRIQSGDTILLSQYRLMPDWLEPSEKVYLRKHLQYFKIRSFPVISYEENDDIDQFLAHHTAEYFSIKDFELALSEDSTLIHSYPALYEKILAHIIKNGKISYTGNPDGKQLLTQISSAAANQADNDENISVSGPQEQPKSLPERLKPYLTTAELTWFCDQVGIQYTPAVEVKKASVFSVTSPKRSDDGIIVSKWRSAEQQAIQIEEALANRAIDVSKKNIGYDIESTTPSGEKRFIEVKLLKNEGAEFTITNNEYTAAHQLGSRYYICLISADKATYIQDPIHTLSFEKRIRQWEWVCDEYVGLQVKISYK